MIQEFQKAITSTNGELNEEEQEIVRGYSERLKQIEDLEVSGKNMLQLTEKLLL